MKLYRLVIIALSLFVALPLAAQYRDDQFKRDAFTQTYADTTQKATTDSSALFSFKEFFGGLAGKNKASLKTLTIGSAVFIGSNQIYNRQYWKLPIVYGGIGAGIYGGIRCNQLYKSTQDSKYQTYSILSFVGAGLFYWGSLMDGAIMFKSDKKPDPAKATVYSLLLPGLGQIYNGEAWKVPIYWAGLATSYYFFDNSRTNYKRYRDIYREATGENAQAYDGPIPAETALYYRDHYRRFRDYSILAMAAMYLLQVIDANVFAYMQDFELSDDLALRVEPVLLAPDNALALRPSLTPSLTPGIRIGLTF